MAVRAPSGPAARVSAQSVPGRAAASRSARQAFAALVAVVAGCALLLLWVSGFFAVEYGSHYAAAIAVTGLAAIWQIVRDCPSPGVLATLVISAVIVVPQSPGVSPFEALGPVAAFAGVAFTYVRRRSRPFFVFYLIAGIALRAALESSGSAAGDLAFQVGLPIAVFVITSGAVRFLVLSLVTSEESFEHLFERIPVSVWQEDFSAAGDYLDHLRRRGVTDIERHLADHPADLDELIARVRVNDVNAATLGLLKAGDVDDVLGVINPDTVGPETRDAFVQQFAAIWHGESRASIELAGRDFDGGSFDGVLQWEAPRRGDRLDLGRVVVSINDVTGLKRAERRLAASRDLLQILADTKLEYIDHGDLGVAFARLLEGLVVLTRSRNGFIAEVVTGNDGVAYLEAFTTRVFGVALAIDPFYARVLATGEPACSREFPSVPLPALPAGFGDVESLLAVPFQMGGESIGLIVLSDRAEGYGSAVVDFVGPALTTSAALVDADRTRRRSDAAAAALRAQEARLRAVVTAAPIALFATDTAGVFTLWEGKALEAIEPDSGSAVGRPAWELEAASPELVAGLRRSLGGENDARLVGSGDRVLAARFEPIRDADDDIAGVLGVAYDITERMAAQQALVESKQWFEAILENVSDFIYLMDDDKMIRFASPSVSRLLGYEPDEVTGEPAFEFLHPEDVVRVLEIARATPPGAATVPVEHRLRHRDGSWRYFESVAANLLEHPAVRAWIINSRDVTGKVRAREDLERAKEAAEAAAVSKSEFLANMSHEIRTPMNAILGMTELVLAGDLSPEQRDYLGTVKTSVDALLTLVNDILDLSKIEAGRLEIDPVPFDLRDAIEDTLRMLELRAAQKGIDLVRRISPDVPATILGDPGRIKQILFNLVGNAVKFTHEGRIEVSVETAAIPDPGHLELVVHVADTGIGIPPDKQEAIFDAFTQADGSTTRRFGGTGLGLAIVTELVEMMGGRIWVDSEVGVGSTFHFTVRAGLQEDSGLPAPIARSESIAAVLVTDSTAGRRELLETLRKNGITPFHAADAAATLDMVRQLDDQGVPLRAVVLEVTDAARAEPFLRSGVAGDLPVVVIAGSGTRGDAVAFRRLGAAGYLTRPLVQGEVAEALRIVAAGRPDQLVTRHWLRERRRRVRVLVADDSPTNRRLASKLLEKRGHAVVAVENGAAAVAALETGDFGLVLMDVQMPEMDGFEATAVIRAQEGDGGRRLPIVALTAHAMEGDREKCLAAGMDAYLSKPFQAEELFAIIERLAIDPGPATIPPAAPAAIDHAEALRRVDGSPELLAEIAALFLEEMPAVLGALDEAVMTGDVPAVAAAAHRLKGSLSGLAAGPALVECRNIETAARNGGEVTPEARERLAVAMGQLEAELRELVEDGVASWGT